MDYATARPTTMPKRYWQQKLWFALNERLIKHPNAIDGRAYEPLAEHLRSAPVLEILAAELEWQHGVSRGK